MRTSRARTTSNWIFLCTVFWGLLQARPALAVDTALVSIIPQTQTFVFLGPGLGGNLGGIGGCGLRFGTHYYDTQAIIVTADGDYTFWASSANLLPNPSPNPDTFLALYQASFDPLVPATQLLGCNDDSYVSGRGALPEFVLTNLTAGQTYVLMNTTFIDISLVDRIYGTVNLVVSGPGAVTVVNNPGITSQTVTSVGATSATGNGNITALNGSAVYERGFCWGPSLNPDIYGSKVTESGSFGTGAFTGALTGLSAATTSHVRAYAANASGFAYGADVTVTTTGGAPPPQAIPTLNEWGMMIFGMLLLTTMVLTSLKKLPA